MNKLSTSWRTTWAGIATLIAAIASAVAAMLDDKPETVADWSTVLALATAGIVGLFARDNKVTSEEANGLKPPAKIVEAQK